MERKQANGTSVLLGNRESYGLCLALDLTDRLAF